MLLVLYNCGDVASELSAMTGSLPSPVQQHDACRLRHCTHAACTRLTANGHFPPNIPPTILPRDAMLARYKQWPGAGVRQSARQSQLLNELSRFWHGNFLPPMLHRVVRKFSYQYLKNEGTSLLNFAPKLRILKISPREVGGVVSKTCRRSSLWITPMMVDASWPDAHRWNGRHQNGGVPTVSYCI